MARRVIATAEVQVGADVARAEAGLNELTEAFRKVGRDAERVAKIMEVGLFHGARSAEGGFKRMVAEADKLVGKLEQSGWAGKIAAKAFNEMLDEVREIAQTDIHRAAARLHDIMSDLVPMTGLVENNMKGLKDATREAERKAAKLAEELAQAEREAESLREAMRDVGTEIDRAMRGGLEGLQNDIRQTIRRLEEMGGQFREVAAIGRRALGNVMGNADADIDDATRALLRLEGQLRDAAVVANRLDREMNGIGGSARRAGGNLRYLAGYLGAAGFGYAAVEAARFGLDMTVQLEKAGAMFLGLAGSVEAANDVLERMVVFARETPYNLGQVTESAAQLLAVGDGFGVTVDNIDDYLESFGNAITMTGGSDEQFTRLVRVFGQMSSSGKVLGQDMNQLAQNLPGYDVWQALADGAGTSVEELRRLQNIGQLDELLTGNEAVEILIAGMDKIPGAAGAMERRMNTLGGALEKFKETVQLSISDGLQPFSETAQETLSDPVILNAVEDMAFAFGDLLSSGLEAIAPELDDLAVAVAGFIDAFQSWTPLLGIAVDAFGDLLNIVSPMISGLGSLLTTVLEFGDGLGKLGVAAALVYGPFGALGVAAGVITGVSAAMDISNTRNEEAAELGRLLAAQQRDVNAAFAEGEEAILSDAQQLALDTASRLLETYPALAEAMQNNNVTAGDLQAGMQALADGTGEVSPAVQAMLDEIDAGFGTDPFGNFTESAKFELEAYKALLVDTTEATEEEAADMAAAWELGAVDEIGSLEERRKAQKAHADAVEDYWKEYEKNYREALDAAEEITDGFGELDEERTEALKGLLQEQADAYSDWASDIDGSTDDAALSLSELAEGTENNVDAMISYLQANAQSTVAWKDNIVKAASQLAEGFGVPDEAAQEFMATLASIGPEFAPALAELTDGSAESGERLYEFFQAIQADSAAASSSMTAAFDEASTAPDSLAESLADGTITIEEILAELPAAMEAAGMDLEAAAAAIDASDEMTVVGEQAVNGLVNALAAGTERVRAQTAILASTVELAAINTLGIFSPSRVMRRIGEYVVEGLVVGMQSMSDEAYAEAVQTASLIGGGIEDYFREADDPREEAIKFAKDISTAIVEELIAEQEAVADAAESLAEAAADRLSEAWERVKDRFLNRDLAESIADAQAELAEAKAELRSAESLAGAEGTRAIAAAQARVAKAEQLLADAKAADAKADLAAEATLTAFRRATQDQVDALRATQASEIAGLRGSQASEVAAIQGRIDAAKRNLDPVARAAAEAELAAAQERHVTELAAAQERHNAETVALARRREDEQRVLELRLANENRIREDAISARQAELNAFERGLSDVVRSVEQAIRDLPDLREALVDAQRDVQDVFFDQFERLVENFDGTNSTAIRDAGRRAGLTEQEINDIIASATAARAADSRATSAAAGVGELLNILQSGLYQIGADGAVGIAEGLSSQALAIATAMRDAVQVAVDAALNALDISSPSRVTAQLIGEPMAQGIAEGLSKAIPDVSYAMSGLLDSVVSGVRVPPSSQLVGATGQNATPQAFSGPLVSMPGAVIQDATDADLVAQRMLVALSATGLTA